MKFYCTDLVRFHFFAVRRYR